MKKILVATDLSARSDRAVLRALKIAKENKSKLTILHVIDEETPKSLITSAKKIAKEEIFNVVKGKTSEVDYKIEIVTGVPHNEILQKLLQEKVDLLVIGIHRHTNNQESMMGNVIERLIKTSMKPVLIVKDRFEAEYKKVLVAVDFNIHSKNSLKYALTLFPSANFTLIHSYHMPFLGITGSNAALEKEYKEVCQEDMNNVTQEVLDQINQSKKAKVGYKIKNKLEKGSVIEVLNQEALNTKPQLMVIGTHGRTGFVKAISLNVAEKFLLNPPCDILVTV